MTAHRPLDLSANQTTGQPVAAALRAQLPIITVTTTTTLLPMGGRYGTG